MSPGNREDRMDDKKFPCPECGKMFALKKYVNVHKKRMHPVLKSPNDETLSSKPDLSKPNPPPPKRMKPSNDCKDSAEAKNLAKAKDLAEAKDMAEAKNLAEANHMSKLPLWGVKGKETFNIGAQYVEGLSSSKSFKDFAGPGTTYFKQFKVEFDLAKSWTWNWGEGVLSPTEREVRMKESGSKMKENLCKAVANFRVALAGATDPENLIYKKATEEEEENELRTKKTVARNLLVCLSYLVARVVPSTRLALYVEFAQVLATALSLGGSDKKWMEGVEEKWRVMVDQLKEELPELVNGIPIQMSFAGEQVGN